MDLSTLVFKTETSDLERAGKALEGVVTSMAKLDKAAQTAARTEATLAKAAKDSAKANLDNAKAQQVNAKSVEATEQAQKKVAAATEKSNSILQRQNDIYDFMTQGFSKGQAGILASAKATGQLSGELKKVLDDMKAFETNPFDKSELGLKRLQKTMKEVVAAQGFFNEGSNLTTKQARELSNDLDRIGVSLTKQGKSYQDVTKAQALHKQEFIEEAAAVNRAQNALDVITKQRKEVATATSYLTQADQKLTAALSTSNAALDKAGTDSLVRYESALRKSGISQELATQKLASYKMQLTQVSALEEKRRAQHLARALTPQVSDVVVSLWSGQSPMTVLLQQGAQINDLFQLSGVAAKDFAKTVRAAMASMLPAMATVAKGIGGVIVSGFYDAGKAITTFIGNTTGMNSILQHTDDLLYLVGGRATNFSKVLHTMATVANVAFGTALFAGVGILASLAIGLKQVITENDNLAKTLALSGAQLGLSQNAAIQYAKSMELTGVSTGEAIKVISEMAKAGNLGRDSIQMITRAAIDMEAYAGVPIEDTVKAFSKFKDKPVEALIELAKQTGLVSSETIISVRAFQEQGEGLKASALAMETYAEVTRRQSSQIKEDYNGLSLFFKELGKSVGDYWDGIFKNLFRLPSQTEALEASLSILKDKLADARATVNLFGAKFATDRQKQEVVDLETRIRVITGKIGAAARLGGEGDRNKAVASENARYQEVEIKLIKEAQVAAEKELRQKMNLADFTKSYINEKLIAAAEEKSLDAERLKANKELMSLWEKQAASEFNKANKSSTKQDAKDLDVYADVLNKVNGVSSSYNNELAVLQKLREKGKITEGQYVQAVQDLVATQPFYIKQQKEINDALKVHEKALEAVNTAAIKFREDSIATQASVTKENESLDYRISLLGKTTEEQRTLAIESTRANKLREVDVKLAKELRAIEEKIAKAKKAGLPDNEYKSLTDAMVQAEKDAAEQRKVINREVAVSYAEDLDKEIRAIKDGITESIVSAMFDGGKDGAKKLRDVLVNTLRKKVTIVVDAVVNILVGNVLGSLTGGGGSGNTGNLTQSGGLIGNVYSGLTGTTGVLGKVGGFLGMNTVASNTALATSAGIDAASAGAAANAAGAAGGGAMGAISTALPWVAGALGVYSIAKSLFGSKGGPKTESSFDMSGDVSGMPGAGDTSKTGSAGSYVTSLSDAYKSLQKSLGITSNVNFGAHVATDPSGTAQTALGVVARDTSGNMLYDRNARMGGTENVGRSEAELQAALSEETTRVLFAALKSSDLPSQYKDYLNTVGDSVTDMTTAMSNITTIHYFTTALESLPFANLKSLGFDAALGLIELSGGLEKFNSNVSSYYSLFYSEAERSAISVENITKALASVNIALPASKDAFRSVVNGLDLTSEAGRKAYTVLMSVAPEFASITDAAAEAAKSVADAMSSLTDSLLEEVSRIRGLIASDSPSSYAFAQSAFAIGTAQARSGDQDALAALPELSQTLLSVAETMAASSVDLARIRAQTANSLETTAATVSAQYGIKLPSYDVGTNYVPKNMVAQIHEGEAIVPKAYNPSANGGNTAGSNNNELLTTMKAILMKLDQLEKVDAGVRSIAESAAKSTKLLTRVTRDGEAMQTVAA